MTPQKQMLEKQLLNYWVEMGPDVRRELCVEMGIRYADLMARLQSRWQREQSLPAAEQRRQRLLKIRVATKVPRMGKTSRVFMLRYYVEAKALRDEGASYREVAAYLLRYRKFKISVAYLKRVMESVA